MLVCPACHDMIITALWRKLQQTINNTSSDENNMMAPPITALGILQGQGAAADDESPSNNDATPTHTHPHTYAPFEPTDINDISSATTLSPPAATQRPVRTKLTAKRSRERFRPRTTTPSSSATSSSSSTSTASTSPTGSIGDSCLATNVPGASNQSIGPSTVNINPTNNNIRIRRKLPASLTGGKSQSIKSEADTSTSSSTISSSSSNTNGTTSSSTSSTASDHHNSVSKQDDDNVPLRFLYTRIPSHTSSSTAVAFPSTATTATISSISSSSSSSIPTKLPVQVSQSTSLASPNHTPTVGSDTLAQLGRDVVCSICLDLMIDCVTATCSHSFCKYCVDEWRQTSGGALAKQFQCPVCRATITEPVRVNLVNNIIDKLVPQLLSPAEQQARKKRIAEIQRLSKKQTNKENAALRRQQAAEAGAYTSGTGGRSRGRQHLTGLSNSNRRIRLRSGNVIDSIDSHDIGRMMEEMLGEYNSDSDPEYRPTAASYSDDELVHLDDDDVITINEDSDHDSSHSGQTLMFSVDKPRVASVCDRCSDRIVPQTLRFNVKRIGSARVQQRYHSECFAGTPHVQNLQLDQVAGFDRLTAEEQSLLRFLWSG